MLFLPQLYTSDIPAVVNTFIGITGITEWERRTKWIAQQIGENDLLGEYFGQIYSLEMEFARFMQEWAETGNVPVSLTTVERYRLLAFMATTAMVYERLTPRGQTRLRGMILAGLRDDGLTPLQQEMTTVTHLMLRNFDVTFSDFESDSRFDFLARKDDIELEIECKRVGVSLGRKIPRLETLQLHRRIHEEVEPTFSPLRSGLLMRVILPERLTRNVEQQRAIAATVGAAFRTGVERDEPRCRVELHDFEIAGTPFENPSDESKNAMRAYIASRFGVKNRELMILAGKRGTRALVISLESMQSDGVMDRLFEQLSDSANDQFSKKRPGMLCVQFVDLTNEQIQRIDSTSEKANGLQQPSYIWQRTSEFLSSDRRSHILAIAFRGHGVVGSARDAPEGTREEGNTFFVTNDYHPNARDRRYSIFADGPEPPSRIILSS